FSRGAWLRRREPTRPASHGRPTGLLRQSPSRYSCEPRGDATRGSTGPRRVDGGTFPNPCQLGFPMSVRKRQWVTPKGERKEGWQADYVDGQGVRRRKMFRLKKDAEAFEKRAHTEVADGTHIAPADSHTISEAAEVWIKAKTKAG